MNQRQTQASFARPVISRATRWVERVLGRQWATPAAESRPRAHEADKLKIAMARLDVWLQGQMAARADLAPMAKSLAQEIAQ